MDENRKEQLRDRYRRSQDKVVGHEEQKRRKAASSRRRAQRDGERRPRGDDWDEDDTTFEKIRRARNSRTGAGAARAGVDVDGLPRAVVAAIHHGRVMLDNGDVARVAGHLVVDPEFRLAVGDDVAYSATAGPSRIEARLPRRTSLSRPDPGNPHRPLVIAANVDVAVIVVAARNPALRPGLIDRLLLALESGGVAAATICVNKIDLLAGDSEREQLQRTVAPYASLECDVLLCSAATGHGVDALRRHLTGRTCVFVGHSGVGKSSVLNAIDPSGGRSVGDVRQHDGKGRHTTTSSSLHTLGDGTRVIDTPGVRSFGLDTLAPEQIRAGFPEFAPLALACRFADCTHVHEPSCAVRAAVEDGSLSAARYESYLRILAAT